MFFFPPFPSPPPPAPKHSHKVDSYISSQRACAAIAYSSIKGRSTVTLWDITTAISVQKNKNLSNACCKHRGYTQQEVTDKKVGRYPKTYPADLDFITTATAIFI